MLKLRWLIFGARVLNHQMAAVCCADENDDRREHATIHMLWTCFETKMVHIPCLFYIAIINCTKRTLIVFA